MRVDGALSCGSSLPLPPTLLLCFLPSANTDQPENKPPSEPRRARYLNSPSEVASSNSSCSSMATAAQDAMVLELMTMGQQSAAQLGALLRAASPASPHQELASEILRCCGRIIAALTANGCKKRKAVEHEDKAAAWSPPLMPPRKRSRGAEARSVVTSATTTVDGFIWRKYGQKDINGRNHPRCVLLLPYYLQRTFVPPPLILPPTIELTGVFPCRLYYRCAYKHQGCTATRRVQRTQDEPPAYEIAYYGEHACRGAVRLRGRGGATAARRRRLRVQRMGLRNRTRCLRPSALVLLGLRGVAGWMVVVVDFIGGGFRSPDDARVARHGRGCGDAELDALLRF
ncbi:hypothetical protein EJB05_18568 [Eragrostis curvula]|uniref:WRKY domain-containing protein n=1 Tax=Eragrostis curvula TaxID=38414 RepID=A0A5J9VM08_9POAL|nr:hypothetical protein EJB05_18568 [Eragrostis curvula]